MNAYNQIATYWASPVSDGLGGNTYSPPVILKVRWEERQEEFIDSRGETQVSNAVVWTSEEVSIRGCLALGEYSDFDPTKVLGANRILQTRAIPALTSGQVERRAFL